MLPPEIAGEGRRVPGRNAKLLPPGMAMSLGGRWSESSTNSAIRLGRGCVVGGATPEQKKMNVSAGSEGACEALAERSVDAAKGRKKKTEMI